MQCRRPLRPIPSAFLLLGLAGACSGTALAALPNGISSGDISQDSVVLWTRSDRVGSLTFQVATQADFSDAWSAGGGTVTDPLLPIKQVVTGLTPGAQYYWRATDASGATLNGSFRTAAETGVRPGVRFGVSGDWRGELAPYPALSNAAGRNLDFFVKLGDTIYADYVSPALPGVSQATTLEQYRVKHAEVYGERLGYNHWATLQATTPVFANIDDHEVTNDFVGYATVGQDPRFQGFGDDPATRINDSTLYDRGLQAFEEYNAIRTERYGDTGADPRMDGEIKLYRSQRFGDTGAFIQLDARSFRDAPLPAANPADAASVQSFVVNSLTQPRTMLGERQVADLKADLLAAQADGVTWKFVAVPEPIQNLGVIGAGDRFEGYARERNEILQFIDDNGIQNVVFIAADIHGTLVNNLAYQTLGSGGLTQTPVQSWEITTGSLAFADPFGPTVLDLAAPLPGLTGSLLGDFFAGISPVLAGLGLGPVSSIAEFNQLPLALRDQLLTPFVSQVIQSQGYDPIGLEGSGIPATLLAGGYGATNSYGWTEFEIDPVTRALTVTTWGIDFYGPQDLADLQDALSVAGREPAVLSRFSVQAVPLPPAAWLLGSALFGLAAAGRRRRAG
jgi:phosphodiesterase/alkaline phosphatase D-like protein